MRSQLTSLVAHWLSIPGDQGSNPCGGKKYFFFCRRDVIPWLLYMICCFTTHSRQTINYNLCSVHTLKTCVWYVFMIANHDFTQTIWCIFCSPSLAGIWTRIAHSDQSERNKWCSWPIGCRDRIHILKNLVYKYWGWS